MKKVLGISVNFSNINTSMGFGKKIVFGLGMKCTKQVQRFYLKIVYNRKYMYIHLFTLLFVMYILGSKEYYCVSVTKL